MRYAPQQVCVSVRADSLEMEIKRVLLAVRKNSGIVIDYR
jgi:hypothetical protein